jgi:integrase
LPLPLASIGSLIVDRLQLGISTTVSDLNLKERKILIFQSEKTQVGRVVYLSDDAHQALMAWLAERDPLKGLTRS